MTIHLDNPAFQSEELANGALSTYQNNAAWQELDTRFMEEPDYGSGKSYDNPSLRYNLSYCLSQMALTRTAGPIVTRFVCMLPLENWILGYTRSIQ